MNVLAAEDTQQQNLFMQKRCHDVMQVTSPSGRAVFKLDFMAAGAQSYVDVLVCREPEPANLPLSDGTVTCYRNDTFIWWVPNYITPLSFSKR